MLTAEQKRSMDNFLLKNPHPSKEIRKSTKKHSPEYTEYILDEMLKRVENNGT